MSGQRFRLTPAPPGGKPWNMTVRVPHGGAGGGCCCSIDFLVWDQTGSPMAAWYDDTDDAVLTATVSAEACGGTVEARYLPAEGYLRDYPGEAPDDWARYGLDLSFDGSRVRLDARNFEGDLTIHIFIVVICADGREVWSNPLFAARWRVLG